MKNSFMIAFALVGTAALATAVEKACAKDTNLPEDLKAKLKALIESQCASVLTKLG